MSKDTPVTFKGLPWLHLWPGEYGSSISSTWNEISANNLVERIWNHDHTVWHENPTEISNRLGWLSIAETMKSAIPEIVEFVENIRTRGITHVELLGMGGSSLAPDVLSRVFGSKTTYPDLAVLDSTDPDAVHTHSNDLSLPETLFIVSTKSGGTVETLSFFKYFYNRYLRERGSSAGEHFAAITDPGSALDTLASNHGFSKVFLNDATIGGRFSALSYFGMVPAALLGIDIAALLQNGSSMAALCSSDRSVMVNPGAILGGFLGSLAGNGCDKATFITSDTCANFGDWIEQLVAESTGKSKTGILPVVGEMIGPAEVYGSDRVFIYLKAKNDIRDDGAFSALISAGFPAVRIEIDDRMDIGGQMFLWEFATAVAGSILGIHPFDQPNVESAKKRAKELMAAYRSGGSLPEIQVLPADDDFVLDFLCGAGCRENTETPRPYVALHAYFAPNPHIDVLLSELQRGIRNMTGMATTVGYGPRFLHSTGQLHKGDAGNGFFIQLLSDNLNDILIPDEPGGDHASMSFGVLKKAQAQGDYQALIDAGRRVLCIDVGTDPIRGLTILNNRLP